MPALRLDFIQEIDGVFSILRAQPELLDEEIAKQIEARQAARRRRDFAEADRIRRLAVVQRNSAGRHPRRRPLEKALLKNSLK